jgi:branched-chain amino acid transport system permease protein
MEEFAQQVVTGISIGSIYAITALAIVLIYRSTSVVNLMDFWPAFFLTVLVAFFIGAALEVVVMRPVERAPHLNSIVVTLGLLAIFNSVALWRYGPLQKPYPDPDNWCIGDNCLEIFQGDALTAGAVTISRLNVGILFMALMIMVALFLLFNYTKLGLAMRATAQNPVASQLVGINVSRMLALGWGLAAAVGAVAGMMTASSLNLSIDMMAAILIFGFAGAVLGGLDSLGGAIIGGLSVGVFQALAGNYIDSQIDLMAAFAIIFVVLVIRPTGLFGKRMVRRV